MEARPPLPGTTRRRLVDGEFQGGGAVRSSLRPVGEVSSCSELGAATRRGRAAAPARRVQPQGDALPRCPLEGVVFINVPHALLREERREGTRVLSPCEGAAVSCFSVPGLCEEIGKHFSTCCLLLL